MLRNVRHRIGDVRPRRPSPAMVVALVALSVALGGGAYAAINLPANSVGTKQLKTGAVTEKKLSNKAVTSDKVKDYSLLAKDFKKGQLPAGVQGPRGPQGQQGVQGAPGQNGVSGATNVVTRRADVTVPAGGDAVYQSVVCNPGERAVAGGYNFGGWGPYAWSSYPITSASRLEPTAATPGDTPIGWSFNFHNTVGGYDYVGWIYVICVSP